MLYAKVARTTAADNRQSSIYRTVFLFVCSPWHLLDLCIMHCSRTYFF